jgi:hypothetical protein
MCEPVPLAACCDDQLCSSSCNRLMRSTLIQPLSGFQPTCACLSWLQVDAAAWYAETEGVANQLKHLPGQWAAGLTNIQDHQSWLTLLPALQHLQCDFSQLVTEIRAALAAVASRATDELERLMQREQWLLEAFAGPLSECQVAACRSAALMC